MKQTIQEQYQELIDSAKKRGYQVDVEKDADGKITRVDVVPGHVADHKEVEPTP